MGAGVQLFELVLPERAPVAALPLTPAVPPSPAAPPEATWQDLLFEPPPLPGQPEAEPVLLSFVMSDPQVGLDMRRSVHDIYAMHGTAGLQRLRRGLFGNPAARSWIGRGEPSAWVETSNPMSLPEHPGAGLEGPSRRAPAPQRTRLLRAFDDERRWLDGRIAEVVSAVGERARRVGMLRLERCRAQVLDEAARCVAAHDRSPRAMRAWLECGVRGLPLDGTGLLAVGRAVLAIGAQQRRIDGLLQALRRGAGEGGQRQTPLQELGPLAGLRQAARADLRGLLHEDSGRQRAAQRWQGAMQAELAAAMAAIAAEIRGCPLAHRVALALDDSPALQDLQALMAAQRSDAWRAQRLLEQVPLAEAVVAVLQRAWQAASASQHALQADELQVWRYLPLVNDALADLGLPRGSIEWQAAAEQADAQRHATSLVSRLSLSAGLVEIGLAVAGAAAPVLLAAGVVGLMLQSAEWLSDLWQVQAERDAFDSALDPQLCFAVEPSYGWLLVGLVFVALQVRGARQALGPAGEVLR